LTPRRELVENADKILDPQAPDARGPRVVRGKGERNRVEVGRLDDDETVRSPEIDQRP
jgi:hypothetical protein